MIKASIVHILGWIMPDPLLIAPMVTVFPPSVNSTAASFLIVSVVLMDSAASIKALYQVNETLAKTMAGDGEGATALFEC